jgi:pimeloyl-ACP methyl ester carboxylesterase
MPRQLIRIKDQLADWQAAIVFAASLPGVDPDRIAIWGFSLSGGHVLATAARTPRLAAAIAQTPNADGPVAGRSVARHQRPGAMLRLTVRGLRDMFRRREPLLVPLTGEPGTVAFLSTPDGLDGDRALNPGNRYPEWRQEIAARSALSIAAYRPGRHAARIRVPLLVLVCDQDQTALAGPAAAAAERAPHGELVRMPGGHYQPFLGGHEHAVEAELDFLRRHLLDPAQRTAAGPRAVRE